MRRSTDARGSTTWVDSPVVTAACRGELAVLDGAHRLAPGTLAGTLAPLLSERSDAELKALAKKKNPPKMMMPTMIANHSLVTQTACLPWFCDESPVIYNCVYCQS